MSDFHLFTIQNLILLFIECIVCNTDILETPYVKALGKFWIPSICDCSQYCSVFQNQELLIKR